MTLGNMREPVWGLYLLSELAFAASGAKSTRAAKDMDRSALHDPRNQKLYDSFFSRQAEGKAKHGTCSRPI
jgi:hypothetical protein